ncbi:MAG: hypothetical protein ACFFDI_17925 [Promethearchaeota archaeon]
MSPTSLNSLYLQLKKTVQKWQRIQVTTTSASLKLFSIVNRWVNLQSINSLDPLAPFEDLSPRLTAKILQEIGNHIPKLQASLPESEQLVINMTKLRHQWLLWLTKKHKEATPKQRLILEDMISNIEKIFPMFVSEIELKRVICQQLSQISSPKDCTLYLTVWISEPYLDYNLLEECLENLKQGQKRYLDVKFEEETREDSGDEKLNQPSSVQLQSQDQR